MGKPLEMKIHEVEKILLDIMTHNNYIRGRIEIDFDTTRRNATTKIIRISKNNRIVYTETIVI